MKKAHVLMVFFIGLMSLAPELVICQNLAVNSNVLTNLNFDAPENLADKKYLGLNDGPNFKLSQIRAKFIIIEIFSMYCPICQGDAAVVNELHDLALKVPKLRDSIKIVGIGAGNTPYEVSVFKKKFNVSFPLIADDNFLVQKALSENIRTPTFLVGKLMMDGKFKIVFTKVGAIKNAGEFLKEVVTASNSGRG
ncbi:MAG: TlpA disulfide reductase family protein [Deltaproteobacteria bacterium]|nr:TlpA disulfide reductase family protein [Deltaproteobacteria bacterium]